METAMDKAGKAEALEVLKGIFAESGVVVVTHYSGLTVAELTDLRVRLKGRGANLKVIKNRLAKIALSGKGGEAAADLFAGPVAIAYSADPVAATKVVADYAKTNDKLVLVGGVMGETVLNSDGVKALATLPSLDQLRGSLIGLIQAPATKIAGVLQAPAGQLARVVGAYADKNAA
jgi:large subunit ribosomal protein L10